MYELARWSSPRIIQSIIVVRNNEYSRDRRTATRVCRVLFLNYRTPSSLSRIRFIESRGKQTLSGFLLTLCLISKLNQRLHFHLGILFLKLKCHERNIGAVHVVISDHASQTIVKSYIIMYFAIVGGIVKITIIIIIKIDKLYTNNKV